MAECFAGEKKKMVFFDLVTSGIPLEINFVINIKGVM